MASSTRKDELFCLMRQESVADTPEERVRQRLLHHLIHKLHFPKSGIVVERALNQLPHIEAADIPDRRADILCYLQGKPLLLIECKAAPLNDVAMRQLIGYNHYVQAFFICLANAAETKLGWYDLSKKDYTFIPYIPTCEQLKRSIL